MANCSWLLARAGHILGLAVLVIAVATGAPAQTPSPQSTSAPAASDQLLNAGELEALVSPIALYPDSLLSNVLMASTYPLEVVQAERWLMQNQSLTGDALKTAVGKQPWDASVKALIATPPALAMMSAEVDWTQKLGNAVLAQQADVMAAIQQLRMKAENTGKLTTTPEQKVTVIQQPVQQKGNQPVVVIEQTSDDTVYVPAYDPAVVYGDWPYAEYPPAYWGYPDYWGYGVAPGILARGLWFGGGYALGRWASGNYGWGGRVNWGNGNIVQNWPRATQYNVNNINNIGNRVGNNWQHNPSHRGGVGYNNANVAQRFGNGNRAGTRENLRGQLGAAGAGALTGAALGNRNAGNRQGNGPGAGNRQGNGPGAGNRQGQNKVGNGQAKNKAGNRQAQNKAGNRQAQNKAGNRQAQNKAGNRQAQNRSAGNRSAQNRAVANRGPAGGRPGGARSVGQAGGPRGGGGGIGGGGGRGGGARMGGGGGGRGGGGARGGGGRRSDIRLKHDIILLGRLDDGLGFYRFAYNGEERPYVGVMAQEVQQVMPQAVVRGQDGYLRVFYEKLGLSFQSYDHWLASGARIPSVHEIRH
jgi:hypothetical protein